MSFPFPGPIPPVTNRPINPQYDQPSRFVISDIDLGVNTLVTTSKDHNYVVGQLIRLIVPEPYGTFQISGQTGYVTSIPSPNEIVLTINSTGYNPFNPSPSYGTTLPETIAVGDANTGAINSQGLKNQDTFIPGSFINISPL